MFMSAQIFGKEFEVGWIGLDSNHAGVGVLVEKPER